MSRFGSATRLASWAGVCPGNNESAGKVVAGPVCCREGQSLSATCVGARCVGGAQNVQWGRAQWAAHALRDDLQSYVVEHLGKPQAVLVVDENGTP